MFYGGAEFSRDLDLLILVAPENLRRLQSALDEVEASLVAVPPFDEEFLLTGLAIDFRCQRAGVVGAELWSGKRTVRTGVPCARSSRG